MEIDEYVEVGEWDLARSTAIYVEEKKRPSEEEISLLIDISVGMFRDPAEAEAKLRAIE